jgi:hypothetical protein
MGHLLELDAPPLPGGGNLLESLEEAGQSASNELGGPESVSGKLLLIRTESGSAIHFDG